LLEFENFVYLDLQKTGSRFIASLLNEYCLNKRIRWAAHEGPDVHDSKKLYFMSIREPLDHYLSLYSYGCESKGGLFNRLQRNDYGGLYDGSWDGFRTWLKFVLNPENAGIIDPQYGSDTQHNLCRLLGYLSYRAILMTMPNAKGVLDNCADRDAIREAYRSNTLIGYVVRFENLREDLMELLRTRLKDDMTNLEEALDYVRHEEPHNPSQRIDLAGRSPLGKGLASRLGRREWFIYETFKYQCPQGSS